MCNWGDYRIPDSEGLDIGAGEFSPNPAFFDKGWKTYSDAMHGDGSVRYQAEEEEEERWWE